VHERMTHLAEAIGCRPAREIMDEGALRALVSPSCGPGSR
jgi:hypothetical protein